jgi:hypothetical protein
MLLLVVLTVGHMIKALLVELFSFCLLRIVEDRPIETILVELYSLFFFASL